MQAMSKSGVGNRDVRIALATDCAGRLHRRVDTDSAKLPAVLRRRDPERNTAVSFSAPGFVHEVIRPAHVVRPIEFSFAMRTRRQRP